MIIRKQLLSLLIISAMVFAGCAGTDVPSVSVMEPDASQESSAESGIDMEQAIRDLDEYIGNFPVAFRMDSAEYPEQNIIYDFTGDGYDDVITDIQHGSGYVVVTIVLYDVANETFYTLGEMDHSYTIESFEDGVLTVEESVYPDSHTMGTVEFINNELVFVADS